MKLDTYIPFFRSLFKKVSINVKNLQLNGSFQNSYWASDIDLYENVKGSASRINKKVKQLLQDKSIVVTEIKVVNNANEDVKYQPNDSFTIPIDVAYVKVDLYFFFFLFPMELTIIYDYGPKTITKNDAIEKLVEDVKDKSLGMYKRLKRLKSLGTILKIKVPIEHITEDTKIGLIYQTINRLNVIDELKDTLDPQQISKLKDILSDNLRRYDLSLDDNLQKVLDQEIQSKMK